MERVTFRFYGKFYPSKLISFIDSGCADDSMSLLSKASDVHSVYQYASEPVTPQGLNTYALRLNTNLHKLIHKILQGGSELRKRLAAS